MERRQTSTSGGDVLGRVSMWRAAHDRRWQPRHSRRTARLSYQAAMALAGKACQADAALTGKAREPPTIFQMTDGGNPGSEGAARHSRGVSALASKLVV